MIINKSCAFQLPFTVEMQKKYFLRSKNISKSPEKFCVFSEFSRKVEKILVCQIAPKKTALRLKGRLD